MLAIRKAHASMYVTMLLAEELKDPLPKTYFKLIVKGIEAGVKVERLAFGTKQELRRFSARENFIHPGYLLSLASDMDYRRMILIDQKKLFFRNEQDEFYCTKSPRVIENFCAYFQEKQGRA